MIKSPYDIPFGRPLLGHEEKTAVSEVLDGPILVHGPKAEEFEASFSNYTNAPFSLSVSSCTAGMHLYYFCIGLGPGDEVIVPAQTHVATAHAVELTGAKPIFVDCELKSGNVDVAAIENAITAKTKAIAVVHYLGVPVNMESVCNLAKKFELNIVEDCALALGAKLNSQHVGLFGDVGVFSFYPVKHITTAEGGMIITKSKSLYQKLKTAKAFGIDKTHQDRTLPGYYDAKSLGFNYRMSEINAAIGIQQLIKLENFLAQRKLNFTELESLLSEVEEIKVISQPYSNSIKSSHYCLSVMLSDKLRQHRGQIMNSLKELGIGSSIYYPHPVPRMTYYKEKYGYNDQDFKNSESFSDKTIALPVGQHLSELDMENIASNLSNIITGFVK